MYVMKNTNFFILFNLYTIKLNCGIILLFDSSMDKFYKMDVLEIYITIY